MVETGTEYTLYPFFEAFIRISVSISNAVEAIDSLTAKGWSFSTHTPSGTNCTPWEEKFVSTWITTDSTITIPTTGTGYNYSVSWTNKTNPGVWTMSMNNFKQTSGYTKWDEYKQDKPITIKNYANTEKKAI